MEPELCDSVTLKTATLSVAVGTVQLTAVEATVGPRATTMSAGQSANAGGSTSIGSNGSDR